MGNVTVVLRALTETLQTDAQLLARFASARDEAAFAELARRHGPMVLAACRRVLGTGPDADDAFQATFLVLARRAGTVRDTRTLGGWLYGVARRVALRQRDLERRRRRHEARAVPRARGADDPGACVAADDELGRLPERLRLPLIACVLEERPHEEVARTLGVSLSTVRRRLDRGLEILRRRLGGPGMIVAGLGGAAVSPALATETARRAAAFASGEPAAGAALAQGVLDMMVRAKIQSAAAAFVAAVGVVWGVGLVTAQQPGGMPARAGKSSPPAAPAKIAPKGEPPLPAERDGRLAQLEEELTRLEATLDSLRKRPKDARYEPDPLLLREMVNRHPRVAVLLAKRAATQIDLDKLHMQLAPNAFAIDALQARLAQLEKDVTAARAEVRPEVVEALRAADKAHLEAQVVSVEERVSAARAARDTRVLELARLRANPATHPPVHADDRLDQVLKELRELREEVRRLKGAR